MIDNVGMNNEKNKLLPFLCLLNYYKIISIETSRRTTFVIHGSGKYFDHF